MKTKILLLAAFFTIAAHAQSINSYYGNVAATPIDGTSQRSYLLVTSEVPLDQAAGGQGIEWNFNQLTETGFSSYFNETPTTAELANYPNTTRVISNYSGADSSTLTAKVFLSENNNTVLLTGAEATGLTLAYNTNNAKIATLPISYGYSSSDTSSGNYVFGGYSGTFTGTIVTSVDATGTLFSNAAGWGPDARPVVRFKTVQQLALNYSFFGTVGNVTQTSYEYFYVADAGFAPFPIFKSTTTQLVAALLGINETTTILEQAALVFLGNSEFESENLVQLTPNPVNDRLAFQLDGANSIVNVEIYDINGRNILNDATGNLSIDVGILQKGIYFVRATTANGSIIKKIIKN